MEIVKGEEKINVRKTGEKKLLIIRIQSMAAQ